MENSAATHESHSTKITFGKMRSSGVRDVLIYCRNHRGSPDVQTNADGWADDIRLSDKEDRFKLHRRRPNPMKVSIRL